MKGRVVQLHDDEEDVLRVENGAHVHHVGVIDRAQNVNLVSERLLLLNKALVDELHSDLLLGLPVDAHFDDSEVTPMAQRSGLGKPKSENETVLSQNVRGDLIVVVNVLGGVRHVALVRHGLRGKID